MLDQRQKEKREELRKKLQKEIEAKLVTWEELFVPKISMDVLFRIIKNSKKLPDIGQEALEKLVEEGLMSFDKSGNWDIVVKQNMAAPGYSVNPHLTRNQLYFTSKEDCERFQKHSGYFGATDLSSSGELAIPETPEPIDWRRMWIKTRTIGDKSCFASQLRDRGILDRRPNQGNFSLFFKSPEQKYKKHFPDWYFTAQKYAEAFRQSFPTQIKGNEVRRYIELEQHAEDKDTDISPEEGIYD